MAIKVDELEQERAQKADLVGKSYESIFDEAYRWSYCAVPKLPSGEIDRNNFLVGDDLEVNAE